MTKQIQMLIRGIMRFMLFMVAALWSFWAVGGLVAWLIFMETQERKAEMKGIRNSPRAGPQTDGLLQSVVMKKFHCG